MPAFLTKEEAAILIAHIERDRGDAQTEQFTIKDMLYYLRDWRVWEHVKPFITYPLSGLCADAVTCYLGLPRT